MRRTLANLAHDGFVELREYTIKPQNFADFIKLSTERSNLRKSLLPFVGMFTTDLGGPLNKILHFYHYSDFDQRDLTRKAAAKDAQWQQYVEDSRAFVSHQESSIYLPAVPVLQAANASPIQHVLSPNTSSSKDITAPWMYELRTYQLHPGYGSVPKLIEAFEKGIPDKMKADLEGQLVYFGYTDVGVLNNVIELWKYPSAAACIRARQASRKVQTWKATIASVTPGVQTFRSSFLNPLPFSALQ